MPYVLPDARRVAPDRAFELNGNQYPRNWLKLSSPERREALGITWEADPAPQAPVDPPLADVKAQLSKQVDAEAEVVRLKYITPGSGQAMTYSEKLAEARLILISQQTADAANAMDAATLQATYPMIAACVGVDGATPSTVATTVAGKWAAWAQVGAMIEKKRRAAGAAIEAATTVDAVMAAASVDWTVV